MKESFIFVAFLLLVSPLAAQKKKIQQAETDKEAIKAVIVAETQAFFETNKEAWKQCWVKAPRAYWSFADSTDVNFYEGWDNIEKGFADYFRMSNPTKVEIENRWIDIQVYGTGAFAHFRQKISSDGIDREEQSEVRILEKDSQGAWKIVHVGVIRKPKE
jgi:hypothetical protein